MIDSQSSGGSVYPFIALLLLSALAIIDSTSPLESLRPDSPDRHEIKDHQEYEKHKMDHRIWQDPFDNTIFEVGKNATIDALPKINSADKVLLMPIELSPNMRANEQETRIRRRYAIHQALSQSGYRATHPGALYAIDIPKITGDINSAFTTVALEIFNVDNLSSRWYKPDLKIQGSGVNSVNFSKNDPKKYDSIVVAYLKANDSPSSPLSIYKDIANSLRNQPFLEECSSVQTCAIGPLNSDQIYKLLANLTSLSEKVLGKSEPDPFAFLELLQKAEAKATGLIEIYKDSASGSQLPAIDRDYFNVFSPYATSDFKTMIGQRSGSKTPDSPFIPDPIQSLDTRIAELAKARRLVQQLTGGAYIRTVHNDSYVFQKITRELKKRKILESQDDIGKVALIVESDTRYGRSTPVNFIKGALSAFPETVPNTIYNCKFTERMADLRVFSYTSGIDGDNSHSNANEAPSDKSAPPSELTYSGFSSNEKNWSDPVSHGTHQIDYIRNLAKEIKRQAASDSPIRAIGILGTDVYDKLLLMRALEPTLGEVVFFTSDLDARLWHRSEIPFTRNMIIGSSYALDFEPELLRFVPAFRDSYQASTFMSVLMATGAISQFYEIETYEPLIYEIGKNGPIHLSGGENEKVELNLRHKNEKLFKESSIGHKLPILACFFGTLAVALLTIYTSQIASNRFSGRREKTSSRMQPQYKRLLYTSSVAIAALFALASCTESDSQEPFSLFNGISAWPAFILNLLGATLAASLCAFIGTTRKEATERCLARHSNLDIQASPLFERKFSSLLSPKIEFVAFFIFLGLAAIYGTLITERGEEVSLRNNSNWVIFFIPIAGLIAYIGRSTVTDIRSYRAFLEKKELPPFIGERGYCRTIALPLLLFITLTFSWALSSGYNFLPIRGVPFHFAFGISQLFQITTMLTLLSYVVYESIRIIVIVDCLSKRVAKGHIEWDPFGIINHTPKHSLFPNQDEDRLPLAAKCVSFTSQLTEIPNRYLLYPFIALLISFLALHTDMEGWAWTQFRLTFSGCLFAFCLIPAALMRISALRLRKRVLKTIEDHQTNTLFEKSIDDQGGGPRAIAAQLTGIRRGAYAPFLNQPIVLAVLTPLGGLGSIALIRVLLDTLSP